ncbi:MAG: hypothetical protein K6357_07790 [Elusimicrobiota bacterium]
MNKITLKYDLNKYPIEAVRYVFYTLTSQFYVLLSTEKNFIKAELKPISDSKIDIKKLKKNIELELRDEILRQRIMNDSLKLREYLIRKAITYSPQTPVSPDTLSTEEEKELEKLIKEVEEELKKEMEEEKSNEIKKTWEEKYGNKSKK